LTVEKIVAEGAFSPSDSAVIAAMLVENAGTSSFYNNGK
jgi:hypothetical protein